MRNESVGSGEHGTARRCFLVACLLQAIENMPRLLLAVLPSTVKLSTALGAWHRRWNAPRSRNTVITLLTYLPYYLPTHLPSL